jgi:cysteine desulfurase
MPTEQPRIQALRDQLWAGLQALGDVYLNGHPDARLAEHLNVAFGGVDGELLLTALPGIAVSSGSACTSASLDPSHVLKAMGLEDTLAHASLRFSVGRYTTDADIQRALEVVGEALQRLRTGAFVS